MRVIVVLSVLALVASAAVLKNGQTPVISSLHADELDEFTAATLEALGPLGDDSDDDSDKDAASFGEDGEDEGEENPTNEVVHAHLNDDGMIEVDDMIVSPEMFDVMFPHVADHPDNTVQHTIHRRAALSSSSKFWPGGRVPYAFHSNLAGSQSKVRAAMAEWQKYTCIRFVYRASSETRYVQIRTKTDSRGQALNICSATLGYTGRLQHINLAKNCFSHRTLLHELGHTLGLIHEHQHPKRDSYVTIVWNNINPVKKHNFNPKSGVSDWGFRYDPQSIMHYGSTAFRKSGCKSPCYTIQSKQGSSVTRLFGKNPRLSTKSDIPIINKIYCKSG